MQTGVPSAARMRASRLQRLGAKLCFPYRATMSKVAFLDTARVLGCIFKCDALRGYRGLPHCVLDRARAEPGL